MAGVKVVLGRSDAYQPGPRLVTLTEATIMSSDRGGLLRALHEAGHAEQHRRATLWWRARMNWLPVMDIAWGMLACAMSFLMFVSVASAGWVALACVGLALMRAGVIVRNEAEASELAVDWLVNELGMPGDERRTALRYLAGLRRSYWRTIFGN